MPTQPSEACTHGGARRRQCDLPPPWDTSSSPRRRPWRDRPLEPVLKQNDATGTERPGQTGLVLRVSCGELEGTGPRSRQPVVLACQYLGTLPRSPHLPFAMVRMSAAPSNSPVEILPPKALASGDGPLRGA